MRLNKLCDCLVASRTLPVVVFALRSLFGPTFETALAQGLIPLNAGFVSEDDYLFKLPSAFGAVASHGLSDVLYPGIGGHGSTIGVAYAALPGVDVTQGQWRLTNAASTVSSLKNLNAGCSGCPVSIEIAEQDTRFSGFDPLSLGFNPVGGWTVHPDYSTFRSAASLIEMRTIPHGATGSVDVTNYMRSLPTHFHQALGGNFVVPGFVIELQPVHSNGNWVLFQGLFLDNRDGSFERPWLPRDCRGLACQFESVPSNAWVDPVVASGFEYRMTDGSLFTQIVDFPPGFNAPFTVSVEGVTLGHFGPGESVNFSSFPGGGVSSFIVSGIDPAVDPTNQLAFPLQLQFNMPTANFSMTAIVPEPTTVFILLLFTPAAFIRRRGGKE